tara:strand:+ start:556 stop:2145 length:1590 start_codon:yes stop_codon:yes gene_type:complete
MIRLLDILNLSEDKLKEIGFGSRMAKGVDDESQAEFQNFGEYVGSLYQKFQTKDLSAEPAISQKIRDLVSVEDAESELVNKIKDLEYLINQLPDKAEKRDKIGYRRNEAINLNVQDDIAILSGDSGEYQGEIEDGKVSFSVIYDDLDTRITDQYDESNIEEFLGRNHAFVELSKKYDHSWDIEPDLVGITINLNKMNEANMPINSPIDLIDSDILDIPDGSVGEIKRAAAKLGIDPQNKYESELRDEIDDLLTSPMSTYEEYELVRKYFGDYADELMSDYGLKTDESDAFDAMATDFKDAQSDPVGTYLREDYYEKSSDLNRKDIEHKLDTLLDKVKPSPENIEARQGLRAALKSNNVVMMKKALDHWSNKLGIEEMTNNEFEKAKEADRLEKHPEKDKIKKIQQMVKKQKTSLNERFQQLAGIKPLYERSTEQDFSDSFDDAYIEKMLKNDGTRHVSYVSGKGVKMTDEDWAQHKGGYSINNGRVGYIKDDGSLHSIKLPTSVGEKQSLIRYMNDKYKRNDNVPVVSE